MSMGFRHRPSHRLEHKQMQSLRLEQRHVLAQRLTLEQRQICAGTLLQLQIDLLNSVRGSNYRPEGICPCCERRLTDLEIIQGFRRDPNDFTTLCPEPTCNTRFEPRFKSWGEWSHMELMMYCPVQSLGLLRAVSVELTPKEIEKLNPSLYHSILFHYGTLKSAFQKIDRIYGFVEIRDWRDKVIPFLGRVTDKMIADYVGQPARIISALRRSRKIPKFTKRSLLEG